MYCTTCGTERPDQGSDARFCPSCGTPFAGLGNAALAVSYAGWWSRVGASLLDGLVMLVLTIPAVILLVHVGTSGGFRVETVAGQAHTHLSRSMYEALGATAVYWVLATLAYSGLTMRRSGARNGQTLGKQVLNIRVARDSGAEVGFGYAVLREVAVKSLLVGAIANIPVGGVFAELLWYLWPLWDSTNRAPHDMIVKSHVVRVDGWSPAPLSVPA